MHIRAFSVRLPAISIVLFLVSLPAFAGPYEPYMSCVRRERPVTGPTPGHFETVVAVQRYLHCTVGWWPSYSVLPTEISIPAGRGGSYAGNDPSSLSCANVKKGRDSLKNQITQYSTMLDEINAALTAAIEVYDSAVAAVPPLRTNADTTRHVCSARRIEAANMTIIATADCKRLPLRNRPDCIDAASETPAMVAAFEAKQTACDISRTAQAQLAAAETAVHEADLNALSIEDRRKEVYKDSIRLKNLLALYNSEIKTRCP